VSSWTDPDNIPVGSPIGSNELITLVLAGSLLVFLRRNIGIRLLTRRKYVLVCGILIAFANYETPFDESLAWFAGIVVALVFIHYSRHMTRIRIGRPEWHTYSTGDSWISLVLPLPPPLIRGVIEPALCGYLGWWLANDSNATFYIGWWLVFAAISLFGLESKIRIARRERLFDLGDTFIESDDFAHRADRFTASAQGDGSAAQQQRRLTSLWAAIYWRVRSARQNAEHAWRERHHARDRERQQREQQERAEQQRWRDATEGKMTVEQALEVLELKPGVTAVEIREAYARLMQRVHPDVGGSTFFAKQLNAARDVLLGPQRRRKA
jgi:Ca2+/Na+ antiporter